LTSDFVADQFIDASALPERTAKDARSVARGLTLFGIYSALYVLTLVDALAPLPLWANVIFAIGNGLMIAMLFIVGHDCQHGAFVPGRQWNLWIGRLAFVPCVHAGSLWRFAHNALHHCRTNLKGIDPVWVPMSVEEYRDAPSVRRFLERIYRGPAGPLIYYYARFWPLTVLLPASRDLHGKRLRHLPDTAFALSGLALTISSIVWLGALLAPERPIWLVLVLGWALPFAMWNYLAGFSFYLNHTHPALPWFEDEKLWRTHGDAVATTIHMKLPIDVLPLYSSSMTHTAHHECPTTPVYELSPAQRALKHERGAAVLEYTLSLGEYLRIVKACKLFDFKQMCWTDFSGNPTSPRLIP
jgi:omega-6 fatty acid desaturase (delta-12 desaturase)